MNKSKGMIFLMAGLASLTLVIGVAYFLFSREQTAKQAANNVATGLTALNQQVAPPNTPVPDAFDPVEWSRKPQSPNATPLSTPSATSDTPNGGFVVTMPQDPANTGIDPATGEPTSAKPRVEFPTDTLRSPAAVDFPDASTPVAKAPVAKAPVVKAPAVKAVSKPKAKKVVSEYWIQVGAFKDRYQADSVSKTLENQGLKGTLTTATVNNTTVVRVRVGPYTNQDEAQKFLAWVKPVKGLEEAYITVTKATRTD